jgi:hypothetical protein
MKILLALLACLAMPFLKVAANQADNFRQVLLWSRDVEQGRLCHATGGGPLHWDNKSVIMRTKSCELANEFENTKEIQ